MNADLFVVAGLLDDLKSNIKQLDKTIMVNNEKDIDWERVSELADCIIEDAHILLNEVESES